jgi:hypothetical protein
LCARNFVINKLFKLRWRLLLSQIFLPRLGQVVDAIVGDAWWFERDELRKKFD